ncbi:MAG: molybdopterin-guanine dinucleotide biosynthesis protein B [Candidatus Heimdallarchaeaceae archaeon]
MTKTQILQIVGYSSTGKTTFITQLIKRIKGEGKSISVIKSARLHPYEKIQMFLCFLGLIFRQLFLKI